MNENSIQELIESFVAYRNLLAPVKDGLSEVSKTYAQICEDLDSLSKNLSGGSWGQLDKVHASLEAQAKNSEALARKIGEYAASGDRYAKAVAEMSALFSDLSGRIASLEETENGARRQIERIDALIEEKKATYNLKDLQKSLDKYNSNIEKISDFINKDVSSVIKSNAEQIEAIRKENENLKGVVERQAQDISALTSMFAETTELLKKVVEGSTVNQQYLFDAFDKWAADRKVKIKKK